jgi:hypothetical protein
VIVTERRIGPSHPARNLLVDLLFALKGQISDSAVRDAPSSNAALMLSNENGYLFTVPF